MLSKELTWHRLTLPLQVTRAMGRGTPVLIMLNALLKGIKPNVEPARKVKLAFHIPEKYAHRLNFRAGEKITLQVDFFGADDVWLNAWQAVLQNYLAQTTQAGFVLVGEGDVAAIAHSTLLPIECPSFRRRRESSQLINELAQQGEAHLIKSLDSRFRGNDEPKIGHAELEFLAPLPFKREKGDSRTQLSIELFFSQLKRRIEQLFDVELALPNLGNIQLQSHHWRYTELRHASKSQPGHTQYFNGCFGSLYFTGDIAAILPWLELASQIHAGGSVELNPLGYCRVHHPARPALDTQLNDPAQWKTAVQNVLDAHDDWTQQLTTEHGAPLQVEQVGIDMLHNIQHPDWQPAPAQAFNIPKRNGLRRVEKLAPAELLIHTLLHELLSDPIDRTLETSAVGFRRGHSVQTATEKVRELLAQGYRYVVESDIEDFFPDINIERVEVLLDGIIPPADEQARSLLNKLLHAPYLENGRIRTRTAGLAQGSPLSPLLANLYLDRFDEAFNELDAKLVRYADDFIILARTRESAQSLLDLARSELEQVGLEVAEEKTAIRSVEEGFHFLGQPFGGAAENTVAEMLTAPVKKTIYLTEPGCFLGHNGDALEIRRDGKLMDAIPLRRVADIAILAPASLSSGIIQKCAKLGIPLTMTLGDGYHIASLPPDSRKHHSIAAAQAVHYAQLTATERLILAKGFASAKISNYKPLIHARHSKGNADLLMQLDKSIAGIQQASDINSVRGHEGMAARTMFSALNSYIKVPEFHFKKRLREKPDRMNVLFNFGYYLLFSRLNTMVRAAGLNPYLGFLHDGEDDYETLVCDIEELFRAAIDRHLIALVNLRIIKPDDFSQKEKGLRLAPLAIKRFLEHFERLLHSDAGGITLLNAMQAQVQAFARHVTQDKPLWYFNYLLALPFKQLASHTRQTPVVLQLPARPQSQN
jgi:CRISPR-associated protein Cas1